jgi:GNAT superfamily N-acetyltransferase
MAAELDNPFWFSLGSRHQAVAQRIGDVSRYPEDFASFLGAASEQTEMGPALPSLVGASETMLMVGVVPRSPEGWLLQPMDALSQMICTAPVPVIDGPEVIALSEAHRLDVLALTTLVYPHFFRPRTMELGRYFGIYQQGQLAAIVGERLGMDAYQEISAVCTHPDFVGRGYARRLLALLSNDNLERGRMPFLHVSHRNQRAKSLYEQIGYRHRRDMELWSLRRG